MSRNGEPIQYVQTDAGRRLVHDLNRPSPEVISPGTPSAQQRAGKAPSDAIVLFDGTDLSGWAREDGGRAKWIVQDGHMQVAREPGNIKTAQALRPCQLHVEFATPARARGASQETGNSGVFLMS